MSATKKKAKPKAAAKKVAPKAKSKKPKAAPAAQKPKKAAPKKPAEKREAPEAPKAPKTPKAKPPRVDLGPTPEPMVAARHLDSMHERSARGFSLGELTSAGIPLNAAKREGLSLDNRRRSVVEDNVDKLKGWFKSSGGSGPETKAAPTSSGKKK
jgi:ribosomal protein L13E